MERVEADDVRPARAARDAAAVGGRRGVREEVIGQREERDATASLIVGSLRGGDRLVRLVGQMPTDETGPETWPRVFWSRAENAGRRVG